jgi:hypothetical protein
MRQANYLPMKSVANAPLGKMRGLAQVAMIVLVVAALAGLVFASDEQVYIGYLAVIVASAMPFLVWAYRGGRGLPILPIVALLYIPTYALAGFTTNPNGYTEYEIFRGELTVALFLTMSFLSWNILAFRQALEKPGTSGMSFEGQRLIRIVFGAMLIGLVFNAGADHGWWDWMGTFFGALRSVALSAASVGSFLLGYALGDQNIPRNQKYAGVVLLVANIAIVMGSLYLISTFIYLLAALVGYMISTRQVPWILLMIILIVANILNTGKLEMRHRYWRGGVADVGMVSVLDAPVVIAEWFSVGLDELISPDRDAGQGIVERASQLDMLLLAERQSPERVPFMNGETYANFPKMLVPRFISPNKITSQTNLNLLSIHYGLQTQVDTRTTTLSWGIVPEAFANFGYTGVILAGMVFGLLTGALTWWTSDTDPPISLRGMIGLSALVTLVTSVAYDYSYLMLNLIQSIVSIALFFMIMNFLNSSSIPRHEYRLSVRDSRHPR